MKNTLRVLAGASLVLAASGCAQLGYYAQAMQGQMSVMSSARPIDHWLSDPAVGDDLKARLQLAREIRRFAASELGLPDNGSYKSYADLKRPYVMWNVVATPELSLTPQPWCFPVAGCVDYRGYYSREAAEAFAATLRRQGLDARVSGVPAYSTLGWFNDPVLSTFIDYPEAELARLVFHELAHQVAYAPGDSRFNESFATAVEEFGVARWLEVRGSDEARASYAAWQQRRADFLQLLQVHRQQLEATYASSASDADKRRRKAEIFASLKYQYAQLKQERWGGYAGYDRWFGEDLSNAHFALMSTYHDWVPAFRGLLAEHPALPAFYREVKRLAKLSAGLRTEHLKRRLPAAEATDKATTVAATAAPQ